MGACSRASLTGRKERSKNNQKETKDGKAFAGSDRRKYSPKEDRILIGAWLNTSKDPLVGNEQRAVAFWKRIVDYYNASPQLVGEVPREVTSCKQRWSRINHEVSRFTGCYNQALREQRSGQNDDDVIKAAYDIFFTKYDTKFTLDHCWRELRHEQKWASTYMDKDGGKEKRRPVVDLDGPEENVVGEDEDRPVAVKAAKGASKKKKSGRDEELSKLQGVLELKEKLSRNKLLDRLLAKKEPLSEIETTLKMKLMSEMSLAGKLFGDEYLRRPTAEDLQRLLDMGEKRGFPGMVGSIDCMHWEWKNCPTAWKGQYARGHGKPTIVLEAVASQDLGFGTHFLVFQLFAQVQESIRKDVERAFGVLQARFAIVKNPVRTMAKEKIRKIMRACIILHNMIVEDERDGYSMRYDISEFEEGASSRTSEVLNANPTLNEIPTILNNIFPNRKYLRDRQTHERSKNDLIENIWNKFGDEY
uniref:Uncharacterized protein n=1 Tax=Brassica oleracea var. oleracea TaxID=109376 RepID=A0A0D3DH39_BRAOL